MGPELRRLPDWPERFARHLAQHRRTPFAWGRHDCALFAARGADAVCGSAVALALLTELYSARFLRQAAAGLAPFETLAGAWADRLGLAETPPVRANRADLALFDGMAGPTLGLIEGARIAAPGPDRLAFFPRSAARRAWAIG